MRPEGLAATAVIACVATMGGAARLCLADDDLAAVKASAKAIWKEGGKLYNLRDYDGAIAKFKEAYALHPFPDILFNLAQAYRFKSDHESALHYFHAYLRERPDAPDRAEVEAIIGDLEKLVAERRAADRAPPESIEGPAGATPPGGVSDGGPGGPPAAGAVPAGAVFARDGVGTADAARPAWYADTWGWTLVGVGVVACGVGAGYLVSASGLEDDARRVDDLEAGPLLDLAAERETIGLVTLGAGVVLMAVGATKLALRPSSGAPGRSVRTSFGMGRQATLQWTVFF